MYQLTILPVTRASLVAKGPGSLVRRGDARTMEGWSGVSFTGPLGGEEEDLVDRPLPQPRVMMMRVRTEGVPMIGFGLAGVPVGSQTSS